MSTKQPSRVVFVGNIPYGLSEEQIIEIFSSAGKVLNFRLVYDRETGKPKGFGFAEYPDADSASSAVRNLHNFEIEGRRLRVDFSNEGGSNEDDGDHIHASVAATNQRPLNGSSTVGPSNAGHSLLPALPPGKDLPPGVTCTDAISMTLNTLPPAQLLDILTQMKTLATVDPARANELLQQAPQLAYAMFQALLLMNLVPPDAIQSVIDQGTAPQTLLPGPPAGYSQPAGYPPPTMPAMPNPPTVGLPYPATQPAQPQPAYSAQPPNPAAGGPDTEALMRAAMALPQATIDALPEAERTLIMSYRASVMGQLR